MKKKDNNIVKSDIERIFDVLRDCNEAMNYTHTSIEEMHVLNKVKRACYINIEIETNRALAAMADPDF